MTDERTQACHREGCGHADRAHHDEDNRPCDVSGCLCTRFVSAEEAARPPRKHPYHGSHTPGPVDKAYCYRCDGALADQPAEVTSVEPGNPGSLPSIAAAADRVIAFVAWFGDGEVVIDDGYYAPAEDVVDEIGRRHPHPPLYARDLEVLAKLVIGAPREWAIRWAETAPGLNDHSRARPRRDDVAIALSHSAFDGTIVTRRIPVPTPWVEDPDG